MSYCFPGSRIKKWFHTSNTYLCIARIKQITILVFRKLSKISCAIRMCHDYSNIIKMFISRIDADIQVSQLHIGVRSLMTDVRALIGTVLKKLYATTTNKSSSKHPASLTQSMLYPYVCTTCNLRISMHYITTNKCQIKKLGYVNRRNTS